MPLFFLISLSTALTARALQNHPAHSSLRTLETKRWNIISLEDGKSCTDSAADISEEETCRSAAAALGMSFQWSFHSTYYQAGCFYKGPNDITEGAYFVTGNWFGSLGTGMKPICSKLCADSWNPGWGDSPEKSCGEWASNSGWGALKDGGTLEDACKSDWALQSCKATCGGCHPPEKVVNAIPPEKKCSVVVSGAGDASSGRYLGVPSFNGTYEQDGEYGNHPRYRLKDTYYTIAYIQNQPGEKYWAINQYKFGPSGLMYKDFVKSYSARYRANDETGEELNDPRQWIAEYYKYYSGPGTDTYGPQWWMYPVPTVTEICE